MNIFTVTQYQRTDCYKRPEEYTETVLVTTDKEAAFNTAANTWIEHYTEFHDDPEYQPGIEEIVRAIRGGASGEEIHEVFEHSASEIFETEYISQPRFEIVVGEEIMKLSADSIALDKDLLNEIINMLPDDED
tara:strand:+ start:8766 stop:9164 length:399 start_codon:yes stop_codon:yes gene_type:complete